MSAICKVRFEVGSVLMTASILACGWSSALGQFSYERLRGFGFGDRIVTSPGGPLVEGTNGALYGISAGGGEAEKGTIFQVNKDGTGLTVLELCRHERRWGRSQRRALPGDQWVALRNDLQRGSQQPRQHLPHQPERQQLCRHLQLYGLCGGRGRRQRQPHSSQ